MFRYILFALLLKASFAIYCEPDKSFLDLAVGYHAEGKYINTTDGYRIKLFRIQKDGPFRKREKTILLIHGLTDSSDCWILNTKGNIASVLVEKGYDVWLANSRGNKYSCEHESLDPNSKEFWQYSFQQMGAYDVPALLGHIYDEVKMKMTLVAHSQGTTQIFAALSEDTHLQNYVEKVIAIAPVAYMLDFKDSGLFYEFAASHNLLHVLDATGFHSMFDKAFNSNIVTNVVLDAFCVENQTVCDFFISNITDKDPHNLENDEIVLFLKHFPSRTSIFSMEHYMQMIAKNTPQMVKFDYGTDKNIEIYGSAEPPAYDLSKIEVPVYLHCGNNDDLSTVANVEQLMRTLKRATKRYYDDWGHWSYFIAKDVPRFVAQVVSDIDANDSIETDSSSWSPQTLL